ncbi:PH-response transcription factor [Wolffia australiana]
MASETPRFGLPEEVLAVLPADPFEQLDLARKITSIALSNRVSGLEEEISMLRGELEEKEDLVAELRAQVETLDVSLAEISNQLVQNEEEKEALRRENASLSNTVKKLNRDVSKLEIFKKTLMQSLQEDEEKPNAGNSKSNPTPVSVPKTLQSLSLPRRTESDATSLYSETESTLSEETSGVDSEVSALNMVKTGLSFGSMNVTPRLTPPGSPTRLSKPTSPRRHSVAFTSARQAFDERPTEAPSSQTGRTRVDGKEFFRQVRARLSYEQFSAFLANVKELNSHTQSKEETLRKAEEIFGGENRDLYAIFEGILTRTTH